MNWGIISCLHLLSVLKGGSLEAVGDRPRVLSARTPFKILTKKRSAFATTKHHNFGYPWCLELSTWSMSVDWCNIFVGFVAAKPYFQIPKLPSDLDFWTCYLNSKKHDLVIERSSQSIRINNTVKATTICQKLLMVVSVFIIEHKDDSTGSCKLWKLLSREVGTYTSGCLVSWKKENGNVVY